MDNSKALITNVNLPLVSNKMDFHPKISYQIGPFMA